MITYTNDSHSTQFFVPSNSLNLYSVQLCDSTRPSRHPHFPHIQLLLLRFLHCPTDTSNLRHWGIFYMSMLWFSVNHIIELLQRCLSFENGCWSATRDSWKVVTLHLFNFNTKNTRSGRPWGRKWHLILIRSLVTFGRWSSVRDRTNRKHCPSHKIWSYKGDGRWWGWSFYRGSTVIIIIIIILVIYFMLFLQWAHSLLQSHGYKLQKHCCKTLLQLHNIDRTSLTTTHPTTHNKG